MTLSNLTSASGEASVSSGARGSGGDVSTLAGGGGGGGQASSAATPSTPIATGGQMGPKRKRNLPGTPDPEAEVIALSPKTLMATNRFVCEICNKGFQRDQNLQLHRRGHNLPWKLRQRTSKEIRKRVYICPEPTCVHHEPSRALGDLTGIKKHFCRKHGEKKWKCEKCAKRYAVHSDWKAHSKTCGTREYRCDCGTLFSRRDSFITHRAFCDALAEESARVTAVRPGQLPGGGGADHSLGAGPSSGHVSVLGGPQSPRTGNVVGIRGVPPRHGGMLGSLPSAGISEGIAGNVPGIGMNEDGLTVLPAMWSQPGSGSGTPGSGTRLSLWSGPGPGPPSGTTVGLGGGSVESSPYLMRGAAGVSTLLGGSSDFDIPPAPRSSPGGVMMTPTQRSIFNNFSSNIFTSQGNGLSGIQSSGEPGLGNMGMGSGSISSGFQDFGGGGTPSRYDRMGGGGGSGAYVGGGFSGGTPAGSGMSSGVNGGEGSTPSPVPQVPSLPQMSATALLQKAAQLGPKNSCNSILRGLSGIGMGGGPGGGGHGSQGGGGNDNSSIALGVWQGPNRQDQGRAGSLPPISSVMSGLHNNNMMQSMGSSLSQSMGSSLHTGGFGSGLTQFTGSPMYSGSLSGGPGNLGAILPASSQIQHLSSMQHQQQLSQGQGGAGVAAGVSQGPGGMPPLLAKSEDGRDRLSTRDFLGVSGPTTGPLTGRAISHRDLQGNMPMGCVIDMSFGGVSGGQLSPKSWDM